VDFAADYTGLCILMALARPVSYCEKAGNIGSTLIDVQVANDAQEV